MAARFVRIYSPIISTTTVALIPLSGFYDLPLRHGKLKDLKKFDAQFFGVPPKQANFMDPQQRLLMEVAYEAMIDAGQSWALFCYLVRRLSG